MHARAAVASPELLQSLASQLQQSGIKEAGSVAIALSGGPDSLALASLTARWQQRINIDKAQASAPAVALVVDHCLRPDSGSEAARIIQTASALGLNTKLLQIDWNSNHPRLQDKLAAAREARYALLLDSAKRLGRTHLLVGHHADDQAETFLLRFLRGSGVQGLACMPLKSSALSGNSGVSIIRPLLGFQKHDLECYCQEEQLDFVIDPTNTDVRFTRNHIRSILQGQGTKEGNAICDSNNKSAFSPGLHQSSSSAANASRSTQSSKDLLQQYNVVRDIVRLQQACSAALHIQQVTVDTLLQSTVVLFQNNGNLLRVLRNSSDPETVSPKDVMHGKSFFQGSLSSVLQHMLAAAVRSVSAHLALGTRFAIINVASLGNQVVTKAELDEAIGWVLSRVSGASYTVNSRDARRFRMLLQQGKFRGKYTGGGCYAQPIPKSRGALCIVACLADQVAVVQGLEAAIE